MGIIGGVKDLLDHNEGFKASTIRIQQLWNIRYRTCAMGENAKNAGEMYTPTIIQVCSVNA